MKKYQIIFHIDLNAFFASCEEAMNPALKNVPIGIGKNTERGILTTANYVARQFGVRSAMSVFEAKKLCPNLQVVPPNFALYEEMSQKFFTYLRTLTDRVEPASIDEAYLDMTDALEGAHPVKRAESIIKTLYTKHQLPASIGIAPNMFLAKMASDMRKPLGITVLRKRDVQEKMWPLPIEAMHGIGKKTVPNLKLLGIQKIQDLANFEDVERLRKFLGNQTDLYIGRAWGEDTRQLDPTKAEIVHSIGNSRTYEGFLHAYDDMVQKLASLTDTVIERLINQTLACKTVMVQIRFNDFTQQSRHFSLPYHTNDALAIHETVEFLFDELYRDQPVHLIGVSVSNLEQQAMLFKQLNLFDAPITEPEEDTVQTVLKQINAHYGQQVLRKGFKTQ